MKASLLFGLGLFLILSFAGTVDYSEQVVMNMPQEAYEAVVLKLGDDASYYDIAQEYKNNKEYYDSYIQY